MTFKTFAIVFTLYNVTIRNASVKNLSCSVAIRKTATKDLSANVYIMIAATDDLSCNATIQNSDTVDLSANAVILLDLYAQAFPLAIEKTLRDIRHLFTPFLTKG